MPAAICCFSAHKYEPTVVAARASAVTATDTESQGDSRHYAEFRADETFRWLKPPRRKAAAAEYENSCRRCRPYDEAGHDGHHTMRERLFALYY